MTSAHLRQNSRSAPLIFYLMCAEEASRARKSHDMGHANLMIGTSYFSGITSNNECTCYYAVKFRVYHHLFSLYLFQLWRAGINGGHKEVRECTRSGTRVTQHPVYQMQLTLGAVIEASCAPTDIPQTVVCNVNATSRVVCKALALKEMCVGRGKFNPGFGST